VGILNVLLLCQNTHGFLLAPGLVLLRGISPALAHHQDAPWLRWAEYEYTFASKTVNKCILNANSILTKNELTSDMGSDINDEGTYAFVNGWSKDFKAIAVIVCDYNDKETTLCSLIMGSLLTVLTTYLTSLEKANGNTSQSNASLAIA
jgi:hypothetical protein